MSDGSRGLCLLGYTPGVSRADKSEQQHGHPLTFARNQNGLYEGRKKAAKRE